jgi:hypothetical protein
MEQSTNPFSRNRSSMKERKPIDAGIYQAVLSTIKVVQVKDKTTGEKRDKILMAFRVPTLADAEVAAFFTPSCADAAHIVKFLKTACGADFTPAIQADADKMWAFVNSLQGQEFQIVVTRNGQWNNIETAMRSKRTTPVVDADELFEYDDTVNI